MTKFILPFLFPMVALGIGPQFRFNSVVVTKDYEITSVDFTVLAYASNGPIKITLPVATGSGQFYHVKKIEGGDGIVTVLARGTDTIDGSTSVNFLTQWAGALFQDAAPGYWDNFGSIMDGEDG